MAFSQIPHCLHTAGVAGSIPASPTIFLFYFNRIHQAGFASIVASCSFVQVRNANMQLEHVQNPYRLITVRSMKAQISGTKWQRTTIAGVTSGHDFTAVSNGRAIGRIYRHPDGKRWQWFCWEDDGGGTSGVCENRTEAIEAVTRHG